MLSANTYDFANAFAVFDFSYEKFTSAYDKIVNRKYVIKNNDRNIKFDDLITISIVEHEYFHGRHFNSSSIGYLLFSLKQRITINKNELLKLLPFPDWLENVNSNNDLLDFMKKAPLKCRSHLIDITHDSIILDSLNKFSKKNLQVFHGLQKTLNGQWAIIGAGNKNRDYLLKNILPPDFSLFSLYKKSASMKEIAEGLAIWKEYSYISRLLWHNYRDIFSDYTRKWLETSYGQSTYRKAVDLIYRATGCNMSMALTGVLLDIALSGPCYSLRTRKWDEVHPSLRLARVLTIAEKIPNHLKSPDNIDMVDIDYYLEIEKFICNHFGWTQKNINLDETLNAIKTRISFTQENISTPPNSIDLLATAYEPRFIYGLSAERDYPSTQLSPWNHEYREFIGHYTKPAISIFSNKIIASAPLDEHPIILITYLNDIVVTLVVNAILNNHLMPFTSQSSFKRARTIYNQRKTAFDPEVWDSLQKNYNINYEDFISDKIGFDYREFTKLGNSLSIY